MDTRVTSGRVASPAPPSRAAAGAVRQPVDPAGGPGDRGPSDDPGHGRPAGGAAPADHERRPSWILPRRGAAHHGPSVPFLAQQIAQGALEAPLPAAAGNRAAALPETGERRYEDALRRPGVRKDAYLGVYEATASMAESFVLSRYGADRDRDGVFIILQARPVDVIS